MGKERDFGISNKVPLFVIGFNKQKNQLIVGEEKELYKKEFYVSNVNFLMFDKLSESMEINVKTRYSSKEYKGTIIPFGKVIKVILKEPQKAITPGQSAVFYRDDVVLGGGKIC